MIGGTPSSSIVLAAAADKKNCTAVPRPPTGVFGTIFCCCRCMGGMSAASGYGIAVGSSPINGAIFIPGTPIGREVSPKVVQPLVCHSSP